jgi:hypothetical protein
MDPLPPPLPNSQVVRSIDLNLSLSIAIDDCIPMAGGLDTAIDRLNSYGIHVNMDVNAKLYMKCAPNTLAQNERGGWIVGETWPNSHITIDTTFYDTAPSDTQAHIMMHELGHLFGAVHVGSKNSLMYPDNNNVLYLTDDDVESILEHKF